MSIVALDPGGTTGVAVYDTLRMSWEHSQIAGEKHHSALWHLLHSVHPGVIVCERFNYQRRELDKGVSLVLVSREYIGIVELYCQLSNTELVMQNPMKTTSNLNFWTDEKLKKLGLYSTNAPHANDATGHLLYYLMTNGDMTYVNLLKSPNDVQDQ